jgi:polyisoprenoid-binding protein YceI
MTAIAELGDLTGDYVLDTTQTRIGFVARHTMATRVRGHLDKFEGDVHLDGDDPSKSNAQVTIQAESIQTGNPRRDAALRSKFLDSDNHPTISFTSTGVERVDQTNFRVTGELTIRGVTKLVTADVKLTRAENDRWGNVRVGLVGRATINRKDWGVHWNAAIGLVSKTVMVEFEIAAVRQS